MASGTFMVHIDSGPLAEALRRFGEAGDLADADGLLDELVALYDRGELFQLVRDGHTFEVRPTTAFEALIGDIA